MRKLFLLFSIFLFACNEHETIPNDKNNTTDVAVTSVVNNVGMSFVEIEGYVNLNQITTTYDKIIIGIELSTDNAFTAPQRYTTESLEGNKITVLVHYLNPETEYYYRTFVKVNSLNYYGEKRSFTTKEMISTSISCSIDSITSNSAVIVGNFDPSIFDNREDYRIGIAYSTSKNKIHQDSTYNCASCSLDNNGNFTAELTNLPYSTTIYYSPLFIIGNKKRFGRIESFTSSNPPDYLLHPGNGTQSEPYSVFKAIEYINSLTADAESDHDIYIKGKVSMVVEEYSINHGNGTYYISDDGTNKNQFYVFRARYLGNRSFKLGDKQIQEGDEVTICGKVINYRGSNPETVTNKAFLYSLNGISEGNSATPKGSGTLDNPYNPAGVIAYINTLGNDVESPINVYVKGKISTITEKYSTNIGNATFTIVEKGAEGTEFTVYRALYLDNKKFANGDTQIKENDDVIVCGKVINYRGNKPETVNNKAYLYSLNGKTKGEEQETGGGDKGEGETIGNITKYVYGNTVTLVVANTTEGNKVTVDLNAQGWSNQEKVTSLTLLDGTVITFGQGEGSNAPTFYDATKGVRIYAKNTITISGAAVAKVVLTCDSYNGTNYTGNSTMYANANGTTFTICNEHSEAKGGDQLRVQTIEITYAQ